MNQVPALSKVFTHLWLLTAGDGIAALAELKTLIVDVYHWLTLQQLIYLYSIGQMAPGQRMMIVSVVLGCQAFLVHWSC